MPTQTSPDTLRDRPPVRVRVLRRADDEPFVVKRPTPRKSNGRFRRKAHPAAAQLLISNAPKAAPAEPPDPVLPEDVHAAEALRAANGLCECCGRRRRALVAVARDDGGFGAVCMKAYTGQETCSDE